MHFNELLSVRQVDAHLSSRTRDDVLKEIVGNLARNGKITDPEVVFRSLLEREQHSSTGIGNLVAVPHARIDSLSAPVLFVGLSPEGIDFNALDGKLVHVIIVVLAPVAHVGVGLRILANVARIIGRNGFTEKLMQATSNETLYELLEQSVVIE